MASNVQQRFIRTIITGDGKSGHDVANDMTLRLREYAKDELARFANLRQTNAIHFDARPTFFYQRKKTGRTCSCVAKEMSPRGDCRVCYKTGIVGGYDKFGTVSFTLDSTCESTRVNVNTDVNAKPNFLYLDGLKGYIDFSVNLKSNIGVLDTIDILDETSEGSSIVYTVNGLPLNKENIEKFLKSGVLKIRAKFERVNAQVETPKLLCIFIRYKIKEDATIKVAWPHVKDNKTLSELGFTDGWSEIQIQLDSTIKNVSAASDWFYRIDRQERWKSTGSDRFDPMGVTIGTDVNVRLIQLTEPLAYFPL